MMNFNWWFFNGQPRVEVSLPVKDDGIVEAEAVPLSSTEAIYHGVQTKLKKQQEKDLELEKRAAERMLRINGNVSKMDKIYKQVLLDWLTGREKPQISDWYWSSPLVHHGDDIAYNIVIDQDHYREGGWCWKNNLESRLHKIASDLSTEYVQLYFWNHGELTEYLRRGKTSVVAVFRYKVLKEMPTPPQAVVQQQQQEKEDHKL